jgi:Protein of unknown function (DUF3775)
VRLDNFGSGPETGDRPEIAALVQGGGAQTWPRTPADMLVAARRTVRTGLDRKSEPPGLSGVFPVERERTGMDIALDKVCEIILRANALNVKEGSTDPADGSNPIDDGSIDVLTSDPDDATETELRDVIAGLNDDERADLIALVYIGRGDMEPEEWADAVRLAREREASSSTPTADWLLGIPNLGDLLDEALAAQGRSCA